MNKDELIKMASEMGEESDVKKALNSAGLLLDHIKDVVDAGEMIAISYS